MFLDKNNVQITGDYRSYNEDNSDYVTIPFGNLFLWSDQELAAHGITKVADPEFTPTMSLKDQVELEKNTRMANNFTFGGHPFQLDDNSQTNIVASGSLARFAAYLGGKQPGDYRWANASVDFEWIATDNTRVKMDAQTVIAFSDAVFAWISGHIFAARTLKDTVPIPADYADNKYWP